MMMSYEKEGVCRATRADGGGGDNQEGVNVLELEDEDEEEMAALVTSKQEQSDLPKRTGDLDGICQLGDNMHKRYTIATILALIVVGTVAVLYGGDDSTNNPNHPAMSQQGKNDALGLDVDGIPPKEITWDRPPLHELIGDFKEDVIADVQFLLDFAIIGRKSQNTRKK